MPARTRLLPIGGLLAAALAAGCGRAEPVGRAAWADPDGQAAPAVAEEPSVTKDDVPAEAVATTTLPPVDVGLKTPVATTAGKTATAPVEAPRPAATVAKAAPPSAASTIVQTAASAPFGAPPPVVALPGGPRLLVPEHVFRSEGRPRATRVNFDDLNLLNVLNMEPVPPDAADRFPDWMRQLDGKTVRIRGFMYPTFDSAGLTSFILARDTESCCFGPGARIYNFVTVVMKDGVTTDYIQNRPFDVLGTFRIAPVNRDGEWMRLYKMTDATVIE